MSDPTETPEPTDEPTTAPTATTTAAAQQEDVLTLSRAQLKERLDRHLSAQLKKMGIADPASISQERAELAELRKAREEAERAQMTELEKYRADLAKIQAEHQAAVEERDAIAFEHRIARACAERGIKNLDYAMFAVEMAAEKVGDGESFDEASILDKLVGDDSQKAALGILAPPQTVQSGATTTPTTQEPAAPPSPANGQANAFDLSADDWAAKRAALGLL